MPTGVTQKYVSEMSQKYKWNPPVIDLGAGDYDDSYRSYFLTSQFFTLDIQQNFKNNINILADICNMYSVKSSHYGTVLLCDTLEHIRDPFSAFKECFRILKPAGIFICTTVVCWCIHDHPADYWRFTTQGLKLLAEYSGFTILDTIMEPDSATIASHTMITCTKLCT